MVSGRMHLTGNPSLNWVARETDAVTTAFLKASQSIVKQYDDTANHKDHVLCGAGVNNPRVNIERAEDNEGRMRKLLIFLF